MDFPGEPWSVNAPKPYWVERLFAEHRGALQAFFRRRLRSKTDAQDLAQEVYLRMLRISDHEAIRNPVPYLYTVANNLLKEHAVLERRRATGFGLDPTAAEGELEVLPSFDGDLDTAQRVERLRVVLRQLRPMCQAAVITFAPLVRANPIAYSALSAFGRTRMSWNFTAIS